MCSFVPMYSFVSYTVVLWRRAHLSDARLDVDAKLRKCQTTINDILVGTLFHSQKGQVCREVHGLISNFGSISTFNLPGIDAFVGALDGYSQKQCVKRDPELELVLQKMLFVATTFMRHVRRSLDPFSARNSLSGIPRDIPAAAAELLMESPGSARHGSSMHSQRYGAQSERELEREREIERVKNKGGVAHGVVWGSDAPLAEETKQEKGGFFGRIASMLGVSKDKDKSRRNSVQPTLSHTTRSEVDLAVQRNRQRLTTHRRTGSLSPFQYIEYSDMTDMDPDRSRGSIGDRERWERSGGRSRSPRPTMTRDRGREREREWVALRDGRGTASPSSSRSDPHDCTALDCAECVNDDVDSRVDSMSACRCSRSRSIPHCARHCQGTGLDDMVVAGLADDSDLDDSDPCNASGPLDLGLIPSSGSMNCLTREQEREIGLNLRQLWGQFRGRIRHIEEQCIETERQIAREATLPPRPVAHTTTHGLVHGPPPPPPGSTYASLSLSPTRTHPGYPTMDPALEGPGHDVIQSMSLVNSDALFPSRERGSKGERERSGDRRNSSSCTRDRGIDRGFERVGESGYSWDADRDRDSERPTESMQVFSHVVTTQNPFLTYDDSAFADPMTVFNLEGPRFCSPYANPHTPGLRRVLFSTLLEAQILVLGRTYVWSALFCTDRSRLETYSLNLAWIISIIAPFTLMDNQGDLLHDAGEHDRSIVRMAKGQKGTGGRSDMEDPTLPVQTAVLHHMAAPEGVEMYPFKDRYGTVIHRPYVSKGTLVLFDSALSLIGAKRDILTPCNTSPGTALHELSPVARHDSQSVPHRDTDAFDDRLYVSDSDEDELNIFDEEEALGVYEEDESISQDRRISRTLSIGTGTSGQTGNRRNRSLRPMRPSDASSVNIYEEYDRCADLAEVETSLDNSLGVPSESDDVPPPLFKRLTNSNDLESRPQYREKVAAYFQANPPNVMDFDVVCKICDGGYGSVVKVRHRLTGMIFALKLLDKGGLVRKNLIKRAKLERNIMANIDPTSAFLVKLYFAFQTRFHLLMVQEYLPGGDLGSYLGMVGALSEQDTRKYIIELVLALRELHRLGVVHRDMKPENILIANDGHIRLIDFGLSEVPTVMRRRARGSRSTGDSQGSLTNSNGSTSGSRPRPRSLRLNGLNAQNTPSSMGSPPSEIDRDLHTPTNSDREATTQEEPAPVGPGTIIGTPHYMAPEMLLGEHHDRMSDLWSLGVVAYELLTGVRPFDGNDVEEIFQSILHDPLDLPDYLELSDDCASFLVGLLDRDQTTRLGSKGIHELLNHPYLAGYETEKIDPPYVPSKFKKADDAEAREREREGTVTLTSYLGTIIDKRDRGFDRRGAVTDSFANRSGEHNRTLRDRQRERERPRGDVLGTRGSGPASVSPTGDTTLEADMHIGGFSFFNESLLHSPQNNMC
ncbi:hypothetical protein KIPB_000839 [Kipferlia bialata]|uniref:non-specific serine/threonine protein kinase n=1 Tax=Kipferlia bialata TaxID=797122 RepID=A0A9K3CN35_9EUKA|nr:hypothetical protein KIPB_000839 [Kipferlia bialata]|eukprot:g839.t1